MDICKTIIYIKYKFALKCLGLRNYTFFCTSYILRTKRIEIRLNVYLQRFKLLFICQVLTACTLQTQANNTGSTKIREVLKHILNFSIGYAHTQSQHTHTQTYIWEIFEEPLLSVGPPLDTRTSKQQSSLWGTQNRFWPLISGSFAHRRTYCFRVETYNGPFYTVFACKGKYTEHCSWLNKQVIANEWE